MEARILHLTLKKKWFDLIASGDKIIEYREAKYHWEVRLTINGDLDWRRYDVVKFKNGYNIGCPEMTVKLRFIDKFRKSSEHIPKNGEPLINTMEYFRIHLGEILEIKNTE